MSMPPNVVASCSWSERHVLNGTPAISRTSAGAGFVVVLWGDMQRMPGLGKTPAFMNVDIDDSGRTIGLF